MNKKYKYKTYYFIRVDGRVFEKCYTKERTEILPKILKDLSPNSTITVEKHRERIYL